MDRFLSLCLKSRFISIQFNSLETPNQGDPSSFADYIFNVFNSDNSSLVDFKKFAVTLSITSSEKMENKLDLIFQFYNINDDRKISYNEILAIVEAFYKMVYLYFPFHRGKVI